MFSKFVFTRVPFALDDIQLASLVPDIHNPHQDGLSALPVTAGQDYSVRDQRNFKVLLHSATSSIFRTHLSRLLSLSHNGTDVSTLQLSAYEGRVYELRQPKNLFKRICGLPTVRDWLQEGIEDGQETYFIVGFRTFLDAKTVERNQNSSQTSARAQIPVGEIANGAALPLLGDTLDIGLVGGRVINRDEREAFEMPGERIYAVCYRKVVFKWFKSHQADTAFLEPRNRWKMISDNRGSRGDEFEVVEADLEDVDGGEGNSERFTTKDGQEEYILLPEKAS